MRFMDLHRDGSDTDRQVSLYVSYRPVSVCSHSSHSIPSFECCTWSTISIRVRKILPILFLFFSFFVSLPRKREHCAWSNDRVRLVLVKASPHALSIKTRGEWWKWKKKEWRDSRSRKALFAVDTVAKCEKIINNLIVDRRCAYKMLSIYFMCFYRCLSSAPLVESCVEDKWCRESGISVWPRAAKHFARVQRTVFAEHPTCVHATLLSTIQSVAPNEGFDLHRGNAQLPARTAFDTLHSAFRNSFEFRLRYRRRFTTIDRQNVQVPSTQLGKKN